MTDKLATAHTHTVVAIIMKKIQLTIFILIVISTNMFSQDIVGKWYAINRSGLIEFKFTNDSVETRQVYSDFRVKDSESDKERHFGIYKLKDKFLVAFLDKNNINQYIAMTLFNIKEKESMEIGANGIKDATGTIDELIKLSNNDTTTLYGIIIYSEYFIPVLNKMKTIEQMTLKDFKSFLRNFVGKKEKYRDLKDNMAGTLTYQLITKTLFDMGYNPINGVDVVDRHFEKFINDPEVKELLKKI